MKYLLLTIILCILASCQQSANNTQELESQIDSLQTKLSDSYKPGFGEFMSNIQMHHMKLWFAEKNGNWQLADFEKKEMKENFEAISEYCSDRSETKLVGMIDKPLANVNNAIQQKNIHQFKQQCGWAACFYLSKAVENGDWINCFLKDRNNETDSFSSKLCLY